MNNAPLPIYRVRSAELRRVRFIPRGKPPTPRACLFIVAAALALAWLLLAALRTANAQQAQPAVPYNLTPFNPATRRPAVSGDDRDMLRLLVLAVESGPPIGVITKLTATADGNTFLPARDGRAQFAMMNPSGETVFFGFTPGLTPDHGWPVPAGVSTSMKYSGAVYIYSASGTASVKFNEGVYP